MFDTCDFEVPQNFERYTINYPSFLYSYGYNIPSENIYQYQKRKYSELFKGVDISTGKIYQSLQALGLLDNTMLIFTTDNSNLIGEHGLFSKLHPYDECMHLPLLIRYPPWYLPGTIMNSNFLLNIDITPTILDVAGITDSFGMEGTSARQFANGTKWRKAFLYEQYADSNESPFTVKTFRDEFFQYNQYFCYDTTEELFDMITDPLQKTNLVHHSKYLDTLTDYRIKLDSLRSLEGDTVFIPLTPCYLLNPSFPLTGSVFNNQLLIEPDFFIYPNPVNNFLTIFCNQSNSYFEIKDILGRTLSHFTMTRYDSGKKIIDVSGLCNGNYFIEGSSIKPYRIKKFIVVK
ncbi:hypothetical protein LBMAG27_04490 [Bacteroidota bacterium]|nr:hypothetical protein LBMAG27_04490 [Bacteroidota bacterium]